MGVVWFCFWEACGPNCSCEVRTIKSSYCFLSVRAKWSISHFSYDTQFILKKALQVDITSYFKDEQIEVARLVLEFVNVWNQFFNLCLSVSKVLIFSCGAIISYYNVCSTEILFFETFNTKNSIIQERIVASLLVLYFKFKNQWYIWRSGVAISLHHASCLTSLDKNRWYCKHSLLNKTYSFFKVISSGK